ncbi:MAG: family 78 glycoside hydrolase catalytic domain [Christensenellales bacterium]|jgi:alpha-L-rhamnosidase
MKLRQRIWKGVWISDPAYHFESPASPVPMVFRRVFSAALPITSLQVYATAMGIYDLWLDGQRLHEDCFRPGFTDYSAHLQYTRDEVKNLPAGRHTLTVVVAGGWAVGRSTHVDNTNKSKSRLSADRQALLCDLVLRYADGTEETIGTDGAFEVTEDGPWRFGDFYDGETYDARISLSDVGWRPTAPEKLRIHPKICARYGLPVTAHERLEPVCWLEAPSGELIADFGQNMAGVVSFIVNGKAGQEIVIRHTEALEKGELYAQNLRSAKQRLTYICRDGKQHWLPRFTYMGFRYIGISGIRREDIEQIEAIALYSDFRTVGTFRCSNEDLNRLQNNLVWSGKSNFVDIPTDCPQRDERQGWTGDIALFAPTACFNFDMSTFLRKWLLDVKTEQTAMGSIPLVVPSRKGITPVITTSCWGDSCILVPWALYRTDGDESVLRMMYPTMKRYMADVKRWAALSLPIYGSTHILKLPFQFGDWCAPEGSLPDWLKRGAWVGTAYYAHSCELMAKIAGILGKEEDTRRFATLHEKVKAAFRRVFTDGHGRMKREFQSAYVLAMAFGLETEANRSVMAERLKTLIRENGGHLATGFPATPHLLFALADNGCVQEAYELLLQDSDPSWLYQVRHGATTMWEQWSSVQEDGTIRESSLNHYAYGAVGDFFYRRICGLEAVEPGYRRFRVKPVPGGGLSWAECTYECPFGRITVNWEQKERDFILRVEVPEQTLCNVILPDGKTTEIGGGSHEFHCVR